MWDPVCVMIRSGGVIGFGDNHDQVSKVHPRVKGRERCSGHTQPDPLTIQKKNHPTVRTVEKFVRGGSEITSRKKNL